MDRETHSHGNFQIGAKGNYAEAYVPFHQPRHEALQLVDQYIRRAETGYEGSFPHQEME